jgi:hypothetical protein
MRVRVLFLTFLAENSKGDPCCAETFIATARERNYVHGLRPTKTKRKKATIYTGL